MPRKPEDMVPTAAPPAAGRVTAAQVVDYLQRHPDFLLRHGELLDAQQAPARRQGPGVLDLQQVMVERLRRDVARLRTEQDDLLANSRDNLSTQERVHRAALALLAARSFENLIETVMTDLAVVLDVDVVSLCVEATEGRKRRSVEGVQLLPAGLVGELLGNGRDTLLRDDVEGDPRIFGAAAGLVRSDALLRITASPAAPVGLLAFGTRHPGYFNPGQGTELLSFLARVLEHAIRTWLDLPP
ncbi:MAG: DUF484 family protein [Dongiaceae bacterium]